MRVVQKNLVFVVGLSPRLADPEILKKPDYFGKFGKIHKVVINHSTQYAGSQLQVIIHKREVVTCKTLHTSIHPVVLESKGIVRTPFMKNCTEEELVS